jgi:CxxC motif-containing protein (DUF1111 family)
LEYWNRSVSNYLRYSQIKHLAFCAKVLLSAALLVAPSPAFMQSSAQLTEQALPASSFSNDDAGSSAYLHPVATLDAKQAELFALGHKMFNNRWAFFWFENAEFGRGPTSNAQSCATCHFNNGRGLAPGTETAVRRGADGAMRDHHITVPYEPAPNAVVRLSLKGNDPHGGPLPHPDYGDQLQIFGVKGIVPAEGQFSIEWREHIATLSDGEHVPLRSPIVRITDLAYSPLDGDAMISLRLAPPLIGLGLLEAIPEESLTALAAREAVAGIHGKLNRVWDESREKTVLGRFGLKANHGSLREQIAAAFLNDIGLSSPVYREQNCPRVQASCKEQMVAGKPEITTLRLDATEFYIRALTVPVRRRTEDPQVKRGEALFAQLHCSICHVPEFEAGALQSLPQMSRQTIRPYTDLLLHDMGEGLADGRPDYLATGSEWRTPALWGIGLSETVNGANAFLHDGRARSFTEAILWHGGEARISREAFGALLREDRIALTAFLSSL